MKGTLILIPAAGIKDETALPIDYIFSDNTREFTRFARIADEESQKKIEEHRKEKERFGYGYEGDDGDGQDLWWWNDEEMAGRLAKRLKPEVKAENRVLPPRPEVKKSEQGSSKGSFWSRGRKKEKEKEVAVLKSVEPVQVEDRVIMDVQAEEVSFRLENDCGLYESKVGYGIVVRLKVILAPPAS